MPFPRVLIIDDNSTFRSAVAAHLERNGYKALFAEDGPTGVEAFRREAPDALLLDLFMPGMDGFEVLEDLDELTNEIPIIVVSGTVRTADVVRAVRKGAWDFVPKGEGMLDDVVLALATRLEQAAVIKAQNERLKWESEERRRAEAALRNQLAFVQTVIDSVPNPIFYKDVEGNYLGWNQAFAKTLGNGDGFSEKQLNNVPGFEPVGDIQKDRELLKSGGYREYEHSIDRDGWEYNYLVRKAVFNGQDGEPGGIVGVATDFTSRMEAERALQASEERYRSVFEGTGTATVIVEDDTTISMANNQFAELSGVPLEEIEGKISWTDFVFKEDLPRMIRYHKGRREEGGSAPSSYEFNFIPRSGDVRRIFARVSVLPGSGQSVISLLDITERTNAENKLRRTLDEMQALQQNTIIGICLFKDGVIQRINERGAEIFGYTQEELIGTDSSQLFLDKHQYHSFLRRSVVDLATSGDFQAEYQVHHPDGMSVTVEISAKAIDMDDLDRGVIWTIVDVTRRRYNEAVANLLFRISNAVSVTSDLDELYGRIHSILNDNIDARNFFIALLDKSRRYLEFKYFEDEMDDHRGRVFDITDPSNTSLSVEVIRSGRPLLVSKKPVLQPELEGCNTAIMARHDFLRMKNTTDEAMIGTPAEIWLGVPLVVRGEVVGVLAVQSYDNPSQYSARDANMLVSVSEQIGLAIERKGYEQDLRVAVVQAEDANRSKGEFLANMSHEIRTPLNGVLGMLQLAERTELTEEQADYVETALTSGRSLLAIINDILDFSKIEAGRLDVVTEPFSPEILVQDVLSSFRHQAQTKGIELTSDIGLSVPPVLIGGKSRIKQILFNLVGNGVKFTPRGKVGISISTLSVDRRAGTARLLFSVEDTGIGIPDEMVDQVFEPFTQVDGSYVRQHQGTGLGLGIVKRLVDILDGVISVDSQEGKGTTIHMAMNLRIDRATDVADQGVTRSARDGLHLLVVEDNRINRHLAARMLGKLGHVTATAANGHEALDMLGKHAFDAVFMDIQMPDMNGVEATEAIRNASPESSINPYIPIIAMTAHAMLGDREMFLESGMTDYIPKPVELADVEQVLARLFPAQDGE